MSILQEIQEMAVNKKTPDVKAGHTVRVHQRITEGTKERVQIFEGLVIKINSGHGADKSFTVRKVVDGIGVEKVFPLFSTTISKIEIKKKSKIRRSKLYYMRDRSGKSARLKESFVKQQDQEVESSVEELADQKAKEEAAEKVEATPEVAPEATTEEVKAEEAAPVEEAKTEEAPKEEETPAEPAPEAEEAEEDKK